METAITYYETLLGVKCYATEEVKDQKVKTAFFKVGETKIELLSNKPEMLATMKNNNLELAKNFDEKVIYKQYVEFCEEVLFKIDNIG